VPQPLEGSQVLRDVLCQPTMGKTQQDQHIAYYLVEFAPFGLPMKNALAPWGRRSRLHDGGLWAPGRPPGLPLAIYTLRLKVYDISG